MLFKTFTGKELLDSSAKVNPLRSIPSWHFLESKQGKKDCHSTVFERLDGVLPLLRLQH